MKTGIISLIGLSLIFAACGGKKVNPGLAKLEKERQDITAQIKTLQDKLKVIDEQIAKLDSNKKRRDKLVEIETAEVGDFKSFLEVQGRADADQSTIATAKVPGTVTSVLVREGQAVAAGQALAYLESNAIRQNRGPLEQQLAFVTTVFEKQKRLWEQGVGTEVQYLQAKTQKEAMEKQLQALDAQIAMYVVTAPISGTVESVDIKIGQAAAPGVPMFKVVNLSGLKAVADVAETYAKKINQGDAVDIQFPDLEKTVSGKITFAARVIDPINRTFKIESRMGGIADVKPNMICKMRIVDYQNAKAITVPTNAITTTDEGSFIVVAVEEGGKLKSYRRAVKTGKTGEGRTEIVDGLKSGEKVVVFGFEELNDGQEIKQSTEK